ncbi:hypothetical protein MBANPS3_004504 [Mucor bainieri]
MPNLLVSSTPRDINRTTKRNRQRTAPLLDRQNKAQPASHKTILKTNSTANRDHNQDDHDFSIATLETEASIGTPETASLPNYPVGWDASHISSLLIPVDWSVPKVTPKPIDDSGIIHRVPCASALQPFKLSQTTTVSPFEPSSVSHIFNTDNTSHKTRRRELTNERQPELTEVFQLITEQIDKKDKINQQLVSFGSAMKAVGDKATLLNSDAIILNEKLEYAEERTIDDLALKTREQHLVAANANGVLQPRNRMVSSRDSDQFFEDTISNMPKRMNHLSETISKLEQVVGSSSLLESSCPVSPQSIGVMLNCQNRIFLSLTGQVAESHQAMSHLLDNHRPNN